MKHNYLNNKDILKEIHKSKNTYCWFAQPSDADYDMIITDGRKITKKDITEAKKNRAERLGKIAHEAATADGTKIKLDEFVVKHTKIPEEDLVFRVMTWAHVPMMDVVKTVKKRGKAEPVDEDESIDTEYDADLDEPSKPTKYVKVNFPPFQHVKLARDAEDNLVQVVVGISHWKGDPATGHYSRDHGSMTN
jgi:predicted peroxiredoxin